MNNQQPMMNNRPMMYQPSQKQPPKDSGGSPFMALFLLLVIGGLVYLALNFESVMNYIESNGEVEEVDNTEEDDNKKEEKKEDDKKTPSDNKPKEDEKKEEEKKEEEKKEDDKQETPQEDPTPVEPEPKEETKITSILNILPFDKIFAYSNTEMEDGYSGPNDKDTTFYISPVGTSIKIDEYFTFKVVRSKDVESKYVKWHVSNDSIASIDSNGKVKGLKAGTVTISATMDDGSEAKATLNVVNAGLTLKASSSIRLDDTTTISEDEEYRGKVKYTSSNPKIATVDSDGKVTPHRTGTVTITGSYNNLMSSVNITITGNRIHFINTHEVGSAILLEANGKFALVDTGPTNWEQSRKYFFEYLDSLDLKDVGFEFVILTNHHADHNGGMISLLNKGYPVKKIYMKSYTNKDDHLEGISDRYQRIQEAAKEHNTQIVYVDKESKFKEEISKSGTIDLGDMHIYFFNTLQRLDNAKVGKFDYYKSNYYNGSSENVNSLVTLIYINKHNILLGSDLNDYDIFNGVMKNKVKMVWNRNEKIDIFNVNNHALYDCLGEKKYTVNATYYVVNNAIDQEYSDGKGNGYMISNDKISYNNNEKNSCFSDLGVSMCDAYYVNNSSKALIFDLNEGDLEIEEDYKGSTLSKRCK